jgi:hypothetical protein
MTDPLSISSAVVGFVAFALQVGMTAANFISDAKNYPEEYGKLASDTADFASLVERLKPAIEEVESKYANHPQADGIKTTIFHS